MARLIKTSTMALVMAAMLGSFLGTQNNVEASGYGQWTVGWSDGCGYYLAADDTYTMVACPRSDVGLDLYVADNGQWVYALSVWWLADGTTAIYYQGVLYSSSYTSANSGYVGGASDNLTTSGYVGGGDSNIVDPVFYELGAPNWSGLTFNPVVDGLMTNLNNGVVDGWTPPVCIYVVGQTCFY